MVKCLVTKYFRFGQALRLPKGATTTPEGCKMRSLLKRRVSLFDRFRRNFLSVPSGCVDGASQRNVVWAAPAGMEHQECESKPDRCYWTDGWYVGRRRWLPGTCYYSKGKYILINQFAKLELSLTLKGMPNLD